MGAGEARDREPVVCPALQWSGLRVRAPPGLLATCLRKGPRVPTVCTAHAPWLPPDRKPGQLRPPGRCPGRPVAVAPRTRGPESPEKTPPGVRGGLWGEGGRGGSAAGCLGAQGHQKRPRSARTDGRFQAHASTAGGSWGQREEREVQPVPWTVLAVRDDQECTTWTFVCFAVSLLPSERRMLGAVPVTPAFVRWARGGA